MGQRGNACFQKFLEKHWNVAIAKRCSRKNQQNNVNYSVIGVSLSRAKCGCGMARRGGATGHYWFRSKTNNVDNGTGRNYDWIIPDSNGCFVEKKEQAAAQRFLLSSIGKYRFLNGEISARSFSRALECLQFGRLLKGQASEVLEKKCHSGPYWGIAEPWGAKEKKPWKNNRSHEKRK